MIVLYYRILVSQACTQCLPEVHELHGMQIKSHSTFIFTGLIFQKKFSLFPIPILTPKFSRHTKFSFVLCYVLINCFTTFFNLFIVCLFPCLVCFVRVHCFSPCI
jgi:hypothetical protein